jgi:hypothetical protein
MTLINESGLTFKDISSETVRVYGFPNGETLKIENPKFLNVSKSGGHRIATGNNRCYYVKPTESWYIMWTVKEGEAHFVS